MKVIEKYKDEIEKASKEGRNIIACMCNYEVKSLEVDVNDKDKVELLDTSTKDGRRIYTRGILYIMSKAINELYPEMKLQINYQLSNGMYCQIEGVDVNDIVIAKIKIKMKDIIKKNIPIERKDMSREEALEFYLNEKSYRGLLQMDNNQKQEVSLYFCEDYYNYFFGVMPPSTGYTKLFGLNRYKDGFIIRYPSRKEPNKLPKHVQDKKLASTYKKICFFTNKNNYINKSDIYIIGTIFNKEEYDDIYRVLNINTLYKLNSEIRNDKSRDIVLLSEALHEKKIAQIADKVASKRDIKMVLIAGPSSSGKTTFAKKLGIQLKLNGLKPVTISVDNYFVERPQTPLDEEGKYDFESINAIDLELFNNHLKALLEGEEIQVPTFDFKNGTKVYNGETMSLAEDEILVIEGIHCLNDALTSSIPQRNKFKIYISDLTILNVDYFNRISTSDTRLIRRIARDSKFRGYSGLHTLETWPSVTRGENKNIFPYQENCDVMFNSSLLYEICVLKKHVLPELEKIEQNCNEYAEAKRLIKFLNYFDDIDDELVPNNSLLREFIGNGIFKY